MYTCRTKKHQLTKQVIDYNENLETTDGTKLTCAHFFCLSVIGLSIWGVAWCTWGETWYLASGCTRAAAVVAAAWAGGRALHAATKLPALLAALLIGILARHYEILDMRSHLDVDSLLRKIYPVIILGKASLTWDLNYIKHNWQRVLALGTLPWTIETLALTLCLHQFMEFPWSWSLLVGCMHASVTCVVVLPAVRARAASSSAGWPRLLGAAGGLDTALSASMFGVIYTFMFCDADAITRYAKVGLTTILGLIVGGAAGLVVGCLPHSHDRYVVELRVAIAIAMGLLINAFSTLHNWNGLGSVAVLVCNAVAGNRWRRAGWRRLDNPAVTAYRVLWAAAEPALFAFTGTFITIDHLSWRVSLISFGIVAVCLATRLMTTALIFWKYSLKEKIFVCCTTMSKSILEAILCPMVLETLIARGNSDDAEIQNAENIIILSIQTILITTSIGCFLTNYTTKLIFKNSSEDISQSQDIEASTCVADNELSRY